MIPVAVEPSCLSFELAFSSVPSGTQFNRQFLTFLKDVQGLFKKLREKQIGIAATKELYYHFIQYVPQQTYHNTSLSKIALEVFGNQIKMLTCIVRSDNPPNVDITFSPESVICNGLCDHEFYQTWFNMFKFCFGTVPFVGVVKSDKTSIIIDSVLRVISSDGRVKELKVSVDPADLMNSVDTYMIRLVKLWREQSIIDNSVPCHGTGTHGSMWGHPIRTLVDVPAFERELLLKLISTGLVTKIVFLAFEKKLPPVNSPCLVIDKVEQNSLICTLRGQGTRQHCQTVRIELIEDAAEMINSAFEGEIDLRKIDTFAHLAQVASGSSMDN